MSGSDKRRAGAGVDHLAVVAGDPENVLILAGHFGHLAATEPEAELRRSLRSGVGACIASALAGLEVRIRQLSVRFCLCAVSKIECVKCGGSLT